MNHYRMLTGDVREQLKTLPDGCVQTCVTSPPYWRLRDYGVAGQIGLEATPDAFVGSLVAVFADVRRVLADDGTVWVNLGDSYSTSPGFRPEHQATSTLGRNRDGLKPTNAAFIARPKRPNVDSLKPKDLVGIPWRVAFALQADGWYLRSDIIWSKPNPMPESVIDRPTKAHEYIFLLSKSAKYYYDAAAIADMSVDPESLRGRNRRNADEFTQSDPNGKARTRVGFAKIEPGTVYETKNKRSVWHVATQPFSDWTKTVRRVRVAPGDADGDTKRTTSPDCPVHGDSSALVASALYGERGDDALSRTARTDDCRVPEPRGDSVPTVQHLEPGLSLQSSDSLLPSRSGFAIESSNRSRRTGRARATTAPCIASVETVGGTDDTSTSRETDEQCDRTSENRSGLAASGGHLSAQTIDRIAHTVSSAGSCICELYKEITEEMSHFATYPEKLIEPCILAGSRVGDTVLDPFTGSGTTGAVALRHQRNFIGVELNPAYVELAAAVAPLFSEERTA